MDIEAIAEEWKAKGRLAEVSAPAEPVRGGPEEVRMELYVMQVHVLRLHMAGRVLDLPAEWFVPAYEGVAAFLWMLEAGVRADLSDGSFLAEWTLRRTGTDGLGVFSVKYPDFQRAEAAVRVEDFIAEGKAAIPFGGHHPRRGAVLFRGVSGGADDHGGCVERGGGPRGVERSAERAVAFPVPAGAACRGGMVWRGGRGGAVPEDAGPAGPGLAPGESLPARGGSGSGAP